MSNKTTQTSDIQLRPLAEGDLAVGQALSSSFGWAHRLEDWQFMFKLGQGSAAVDKNKKVVGAGMWWSYGDFATIGMVVVDKEKQGQGIGRRLMNAMVEEAGDRGIILNASRAGKPLYESMGFETTGAIEQHQGAAAVRNAEPVLARGTIEPVTQQNITVVNQLDEVAAGMPRLKLIHALFQEGQGLLLKRDGEVKGFAFRRDFGHGQVIGPVVAPSSNDAIALIAEHLKAIKEGAFVRVDIPAPNPDMAHWLESAGMPSVGGTTTMVKGKRPESSGNSQMFAISSQALG